MIEFKKVYLETPYSIFKQKYQEALDAGQKNIEAIWGNTHASFGMFAYVQSRNGSIVNNHQVHLNCRPCSKLGSKTCPRNHFNCMQLQDWETIVNNCNSID